MLNLWRAVLLNFQAKFNQCINFATYSKLELTEVSHLLIFFSHFFPWKIIFIHRGFILLSRRYRSQIR
jgi:hypothetical protein